MKTTECYVNKGSLLPRTQIKEESVNLRVTSLQEAVVAVTEDSPIPIGVEVVELVEVSTVVEEGSKIPLHRTLWIYHVSHEI